MKKREVQDSDKSMQTDETEVGDDHLGAYHDLDDGGDDDEDSYGEDCDSDDNDDAGDDAH